MNRSLFLTAVLFVSTAINAIGSEFGTPTISRPNVLFIVADDLNCAIGPYTDDAAKTPNLDALSKRGVTFLNAYCQQAVCNPSRSSFLTGLRPDTVKVDDLRKSFRETTDRGASLVTLPQHFKNNDYFCQNVGKLFHNMGETQDRRSWSIDEAFFKGTHADDTIFANRNPYGKKLPYKAPVTEAFDVPDTYYRDGQIANLAATMLRDHRPSDPPFFLAVGFWRPHLPFVAPKKYWDLYKPEDITAPTPDASPINAPAIAIHASREIHGYGHVAPDRLPDAAETRHLRHGYYASISFMDAQIGEILSALDEGGHSARTIVVFTSDHGFHLGEQSLWGKTSNFELDARVPLIIASPEHHGTAGRSTEAMFELIDLYPTLAELSGIGSDVSDHVEGVSQIKVLSEPSAIVKDFALTQHQQPFYGSRNNWQANGYSIRTTDWRYTEWLPMKKGQLIPGATPIATELYDYRNRRVETANLVHDPEQAERAKSLAKRLAAARDAN